MMSQSAEGGAAVVREWYANDPWYCTRVSQNTTRQELQLRACACTCGWVALTAGDRDEISDVTKVLMEDMLLANYTD